MTRRSSLKLLSALAGSFALGTGIAAAERGNANEGPMDRSDPNTAVVRYHDSLRAVTNEPHLLALSESAIDRHFAASDLEGREFERARRYLRNLRKRYPTKRVETGNVEWITLADEAKHTLANTRRRQRSILQSQHHSEDLSQPDEGGLPSIQSRSDTQARRTAIDVFAGSPPDEASIQWKPNHHEEILQTALDDVGSNATMAKWAGKPDDFDEMANGRLGIEDGSLEFHDLPDNTPFGIDDIESFLGGALKKALKRTMDNYAQYYDPNTVTISIPHVGNLQVGDVGMAPHAGKTFYMAARTQHNYNKRKYLSYSTHYLHDMAVPLHTGMGLEQAGLHFDVKWDGWTPKLTYGLAPKMWLHSGFEQLVQSKWDSSLEDAFSGIETNWFDDSAQAIEAVARESSKYADDVFHRIMNNESDGNWGNWSVKSQILENVDSCFDICGAYNRGFLKKQGFGY